jgi:hypothetical protein
VRLTSVFSKADKVNPFPTCIVEGGEGQDVHNVEVADVVHREFLTSRTVYHVVRRELFSGYGLPVPAEPRSKRLINLR